MPSSVFKMFKHIVLLSLLTVAFTQKNETWQKYIYGPQERIVYPKTIISVSGNVLNAEALIGGGGITTLTRNAGGDRPEVVLDFGINLVGFLQISFNGASNNTPGIRLATSETMQYLGDLSDFTRSTMPGTPIPITPGSDQIAVASEPYQWNGTFGCQYDNKVCSDGFHGFRYLKIYLDALESDAPFTQSTGIVHISSISLNYTGFLPTPDSFQGWFESSDDQINQFWYGAVYTNDLTTDTFRKDDIDPLNAFSPYLDGKLVLFDGAKRDRAPFIGDIAVSALTTYISHGSLSSIAVKNVMIDLVHHQRQEDGYMPATTSAQYSDQFFDYPIYWVTTAHDYVLHTGDMEFLENYFTNLEDILNKFFLAHTNTSSNLLSKPEGYLDYALVARYGEACYYNSLYVLGLKVGAECALWLGKNETAADWLSRAESVSKAINEAFWDNSTGSYKTTHLPSSHSQDSTSFSVLAGVANLGQAVSALNYLTNVTARPYGNAYMDDDTFLDGASQRVYAFISTSELRARFMTDLPEMAESAVEEIRRLYGWMHTQDPGVTYWEGVGPDGSMYQGGFTSAAHGWSSGVAGVLTNFVLGIQLTAPGGTSFIFDPKESGLEWAQGVFPTINGPFHARWGPVNNTYTMELSVPPNTSGSARIRIGSASKVTYNSQVVWEMGQLRASGVRKDGKRHIVVSELGEGRHVIARN